MIADLKAHHFAAALETVQPLTFTGRVVTRFGRELYRARITSTEGAERYGGRWNAPGTPALYTSLERATALAEWTEATDDRIALPPASMVSLIVSAQCVVDFTDATLCSRFGLGSGELVRPYADDDDYRTPQHLASLALGWGAEGLLVPRAVLAGGRNLILFPDRAARPPIVVSDIRS